MPSHGGEIANQSHLNRYPNVSNGYRKVTDLEAKRMMDSPQPGIGDVRVLLVDDEPELR